MVYLEKIAEEVKNNKEKDPNRTKWMKDRIGPALRSETHALKGGLIGAGIGAGISMAGTVATSSALKATAKRLKQESQNPNFVKNVDKLKDVAQQKIKSSGIDKKPSGIAAKVAWKKLKKSGIKEKSYEFMTSPDLKKARLGVSAVSGATSSYGKGAKTGRVVGDMKDLEKKTRETLHREPTEKEYSQVARLDNNNAFDKKLGRLLYNPNAMIKSNLRQGK